MEFLVLLVTPIFLLSVEVARWKQQAFLLETPLGLLLSILSLKCFVDYFFNSNLLHEQLLFLVLDMHFILFELDLEVILLVFCNSMLLYEFLLYLL
jgi:hypothetical protein